MDTHCVWAVCKDPGGTNGLLPVVSALARRGVNVKLIANGKATELLGNNPEFGGFTPATSIDALLAESPNLPDLLITSMCSEGGVGRNLVPLLRERGIPTIALQDFWAARLFTAWQDKAFRPGYIVVNDVIGKKIVLSAWPEMNKDHILVYGFPALDKYAGIDSTALAAQAQTKLRLDETKPVVLVCGELEGTAHMFEQIIWCLNELQIPVTLIPRFHPRMLNNAPEEARPCEEAIAHFASGTIVSDTSQCSTPSLIARSTVALSIYSTVLIEAACLRKQNISVMFPDVGMRIFKQSTGNSMADFPLVDLGCSASAKSHDQLRDLLRQSLTADLNLYEKQQEHFALDGHNADRVADFVVSMLQSRSQ